MLEFSHPPRALPRTCREWILGREVVQSRSGGGSSFPDNKSSTPTGPWAHVSSERSLGLRRGLQNPQEAVLPQSKWAFGFCLLPGLRAQGLSWVCSFRPRTGPRCWHRHFPHNGPQKRGDLAKVTQNERGRAGTPRQAVWLLNTRPGFCLWQVRAAHSLPEACLGPRQLRL